MGRRQVHSDYQVKNTFVELVGAPEEVEFSRNGQRAMSVNDAGTQPVSSLPQDCCPQTPSPFMHPAHAPHTAYLPPLEEYGLPTAGMPIAFGDLPAESELNGFDDSSYNQSMMYDPTTGMYMAYNWQMQYDQGCYPMMGNVQGSVGEDFQIGGCMQMPMEQADGNAQTETLLAALSEKLAAGKGSVPDGYTGPGYGENDLRLPIPEAMIEPYDPQAQEAYSMHQSGEMYPSVDLQTIAAGGLGLGQQPEQQHAERGGRKSRNERHRDKLVRSDRGDRGDRGDEVEYDQRGMNGRELSREEALQQHGGPVTFTTVMFRNIPNKYTREMLVNQLEQDLKGMFDFVYLPIDFKNKCNVGYAFINFRTIQACECFLLNFNGVEVRKCLPGLNSRKVTEVTPARVQGFEENVQRLRNSPVMRELAHHLEWMPLIFDEHGTQVPFPAPERPLEHIKPRRRGRDDAGRD